MFSHTNDSIVFWTIDYCSQLDIVIFSPEDPSLNDLTRGERLKSALYLRLKKHKTLFWKKLKLLNFFGKCCIVPKKCKRGDPLGFINIHSVAKYLKTRRRVPFETLKKFGSRTVPKNQKGDPPISSGFVGYLKKVQNERGTLCTKFAWAGFGLSDFRGFSKKWTDQCESEEKSHCKSRAFFFKKNAPTKNKGVGIHDSKFDIFNQRKILLWKVRYMTTLWKMNVSEKYRAENSLKYDKVLRVIQLFG